MKQRLKASYVLWVALALALVMGVGCNSQTNFQLWMTAGSLIDQWTTIYAPQWPQKVEFDTAWAKAGTDIQNWVGGTPCQSVEQGVNDALGIIAEVPSPSPTASALLATAVVGAEVVETFFVKCGTTSSGLGILAPTERMAWMDAAQAVTVKRTYKSPTLQKAVAEQRKSPATNSKMLQRQWKKAGGK